ncbi:MAG: hypothetical protein MZV64_05370 [Ignavibacteriales bacterium]|nr:hypothetical protein [Ignavibacteriales bacterium]
MIFWEEFRSSGYAVSVQRIDSSGNNQFSSEGKLLYFSNEPLTQYEFIKSKPDKIYFLYTNSNHNTFTQILDYDGNYLSGGEIPICTTQSSISSLVLYDADANGIVLAWQDNRNGNFDIYAQWINSDGLAMWTANGVPVCIEVSEQTEYDICSCSISGAVVAWADMRNGNFDIYAQNIDVRGKLGSSRYIFSKKWIE